MNKRVFVGLCGAPGSGKTTLAEMLVASDPKSFSLVDDGRPLRDAGKVIFGLSEEDVSTQEGKARETDILGKNYTVRDILGSLGEFLENHYGDQVIPDLAIKKVLHDGSYPPVVIFGSVRKNQGIIIRKHGGIIIEVVRDGCKPYYSFDYYDETLVDRQIFNNGSMEELREMAGQLARTLLSLSE